MPSTLDAQLRRINRQTEETAAEELAKRLNLTYANLDEYPFTYEALSLMPLKDAQEKLFCPYVRTKEQVRIAVVHPESGPIRQEITIKADEWGAKAELTVVSTSSFEYLITSYLKLQKEKQEEEAAHQQAAKVAEQKDYLAHVKTLDDLQKAADKVSVTEVLDVLVAAAYNQEASDIHLEPGDAGLTVRFRIDGVLQKVLTLPMQYHHQLVARIKMLAAIKLDVNSLSQDGRFSILGRGMDADFRVSILPTGYGEGVVMRILRRNIQSLTLENLGFSGHNMELIERALKRPYGLILVTGPTGSGKSTTLYAMLQKLNSTERKIITLEDPIEYKIPGLQQSQIDPGHGFTFAEGLKGALRQDPDVVMVGEIRDPETATIALNASITGHLVLSTLHTNDAVTAHTRFLELGVPPYLLSGSIQLIVAQRLVRILQPGSTPEDPQYHGRIVIAEVLVPSPEFEQAVIARADISSLRQIAINNGMIQMVQDGMDKVKEGKTTEQEVYRVTAD